MVKKETKQSKPANKKAVKKKTAKKASKTSKTSLNKVSLKSKPVTKKVSKKTGAKKNLATSQNSYLGDAQFLASIKPYALKKNEKYMNGKQKSHFDTILKSWQSQLLLEQEKTADKLQDKSSNFPDDSDRATHEEEFTLELKTRERERRLLSKINESIEELNLDDYGFCASCGIEIGIRRLEARPTATRCIDCKTIEEIHERQKYG